MPAGVYGALDGGGGIVVGGAGREGDGRAEADFHVAAAQEGEPDRGCPGGVLTDYESIREPQVIEERGWC